MVAGWKIRQVINQAAVALKGASKTGGTAMHMVPGVGLVAALQAVVAAVAVAMSVAVAVAVTAASATD